MSGVYVGIRALTRRIRYFVRLPHRALKVIFTQGWAAFWAKLRMWSRRLASGQLTYEIPRQHSVRAAGKNSAYFAEDVHYVSKIVQMLEGNNRSVAAAGAVLEVIVPIYNAYDDFLKCLYSLLIHQDVYRVILLDDCSTDFRVREFLQILKEYDWEGFRIAENLENLGYLKTVNKGMRMANRDVILLNTDTIVTRGWARKMRACAYSDNKIATVTPFTNNGRMCSIPEFLDNNEIPEGFTVDSFGECVEDASSNRYPELVTAVGFCMYIRRSVLEDIGYFDEINFELGYGEEVDFSFRAANKGYKNVLCDNTFVFHKGRASFLDVQESVMDKNHMVLAEKYPDLWAAIALFERSNPLKELHEQIKTQMRMRRIHGDEGHPLKMRTKGLIEKSF